MTTARTIPTSRASSSPWGEATWSGTSPLLGFRSQVTDPATGAVFTPARSSLPALARFSSPDPRWGDPAEPRSRNRYLSAQDDPITRSDPTGLRPVCGEGCTPEQEAELVSSWAEAQTQAAISDIGGDDPGRLRDPGPVWRPPGLPVRGLPFAVTVDEVSQAGTAGAFEWLATARLGLSGTNRGLLLVLARDGTLRGLLLSLEQEVLASGLGGVQTVPTYRAGIRLRIDPGAVSLGSTFRAGIAGPLSVSAVRTTSGVSTRLGRPGAYLETEVAIGSPNGTPSGSATVRVDLAPREPSVADLTKWGARLTTVVTMLWMGLKAAGCLVTTRQPACVVA